MARQFGSSSSSSRSTGRRYHTTESSNSLARSNSNFVEMNYEAEVGEVKKCLCNLKAPRFTPWKTDKNPGRRYFGCPNWTWKENQIVHFCKYFEWYDTKFTERSVFLIRSLRDERDIVTRQRDGYKRDLEFVKIERDELLRERVDLIDDREALMAELRSNEVRRVAEIQQMASAMAALEKEKNCALVVVKWVSALVVVGLMIVSVGVWFK